MKAICAVLLFSSFSLAFGQSEMARQTVAMDPPFTLSIGYNESNPNEEIVPTHIVVSCNTMTLRIKKTNTSNREIAKRSHTGGSFGYFYEVHKENENSALSHPSESTQTRTGGPLMKRGSLNAVLQPGESVIDYVPSTLFDMCDPGEYTIQVWAHVSEDPKSEIVKSNILKVTVKPETVRSAPTGRD